MFLIRLYHLQDASTFPGFKLTLLFTLYDFLKEELGFNWYISSHLAICLPYFIEYSAHFLYTENDAEIFSAHYTFKVVEKGVKMAFMTNKLAMINSCEIILEK